MACYRAGPCASARLAFSILQSGSEASSLIVEVRKRHAPVPAEERIGTGALEICCRCQLKKFHERPKWMFSGLMG